MEREIGETFEYEGKRLKVMADRVDTCEACFFDGHCTRGNKALAGKCGSNDRDDGKNVIFVEVQEPKKEKFDPKTLKAFDKVLARLDSKGIWCCELFSFIEDNTNLIKCCGAYYKHCIPYNDDTKHLVGTTDEAPEYYRYWED